MSEVRWSTDTEILVDANLRSNNMNIKVNLVDDGFANITVDNIYGVSGDYEFFDGEYEVTPKVIAQTLETKDKLMADDVTVFAIPYFETSNEHGTTVYIADSLD